ncbi:MAG: Trm112 family protein [Desulfurococcaceae archaeon]
MRYALLNVLICPMCKHFPLKVFVFNEKRLGIHVETEPGTAFCDLYCGYNGVFISEKHEVRCKECLSRDILWGILYCNKCHRWYPVINGIPLLYPDDIRKNTFIKHIEEGFIHKYQHHIPREILANDPLRS